MSLVDRGNMSSVGCAGALACTFFTDAAGTIVETDQRYNDAITFSNVGAAGAYDSSPSAPTNRDTASGCITPTRATR